MATMSGRGVITSRTSVSPKSTIDSQQPRAPRRSMQALLLAGLEIGVRGFAVLVVARRLAVRRRGAGRSRRSVATSRPACA